MKTFFLILISLVIFNFGQSQTQSKLEDYPFGSLDVDVVVFPFGMDNPIKIGSVSKSGDINFDFPEELPKLSKDDIESESSKLWYTVLRQCDNASKIVAEKDNCFSFDAGYLSLSTSDNPYAGVIFIVSDENLKPWIEDPAYMEPILGSYFELIYVENAFQYTGDCTTNRMMEEGEDDVKIEYTYNLNLKAGFNFMEYKIENIHKTEPNVMASFPDKVSVTSVEGIPNCKWIGKYF